eukprot:scaffold7740_cov267-Pinguiococcus_pyrenoidosus.AAC.1
MKVLAEWMAQVLQRQDEDAGGGTVGVPHLLPTASEDLDVGCAILSSEVLAHHATREEVAHRLLRHSHGRRIFQEADQIGVQLLVAKDGSKLGNHRGRKEDPRGVVLVVLATQAYHGDRRGGAELEAEGIDGRLQEANDGVRQDSMEGELLLVLVAALVAARARARDGSIRRHVGRKVEAALVEEEDVPLLVGQELAQKRHGITAEVPESLHGVHLDDGIRRGQQQQDGVQRVRLEQSRACAWQDAESLEHIGRDVVVQRAAPHGHHDAREVRGRPFPGLFGVGRMRVAAWVRERDAFLLAWTLFLLQHAIGSLPLAPRRRLHLIPLLNEGVQRRDDAFVQRGPSEVRHGQRFDCQDPDGIHHEMRVGQVEVLSQAVEAALHQKHLLAMWQAGDVGEHSRAAQLHVVHAPGLGQDLRNALAHSGLLLEHRGQHGAAAQEDVVQRSRRVADGHRVVQLGELAEHVQAAVLFDDGVIDRGSVAVKSCLCR